LKKTKSLSELRTILRSAKSKGKTIVLANGCFDLIHAGHIRYLKEARRKGDVLVVALNSDSSIRKLKGKRRPLLPQKERAEILSSFPFVDYLLIFRETDVEKILRILKPDFHAKGSDYTPASVPERETVKRIGGKIAITGGPKIRSTSEIIRRISRSYSKAGSGKRPS
jgi:rfaE bifunctional protein nucleotidyltransferase chain/domain